jgi:hypothetical protein
MEPKKPVPNVFTIRCLGRRIGTAVIWIGAVVVFGGSGLVGWGCASVSHERVLQAPLANMTPSNLPSPTYMDDLNHPAPPNRLHLPKGGRFPLSEITPQPIIAYDAKQVAQMWPAFQHVPFEKGGFNATSLPFRYSDSAGLGNRDEAAAFAFLLSSALDWAPGCYCSRHAYFTFKRSRRVLEPMQKEYDRLAIAPHIASWGATHAIGGSLSRSKAGYTGTLEIFNARGRTVMNKKYEDPQPYFDLLGQMAADAMRLFGDEPSPALAAYLKKPRCARAESIALLGSAAFMEEKSAEEFAVYQKIIEQDPQFGEVRHWWANQKYWRDRDSKNFEIQKALSLQSYFSEAALGDFDPANCADRDLAAKYPEWLKQVEQLVGADHPTLLQLQMTANRAAQRFDAALLDRAIRAAGRNPNRNHLLRSIANSYNGGPDGPCDADWAASISYAGLQDLFIPGSGGKEYELNNFATQMISLGRNDICAQAMANADNEYQLVRLIPALLSMGRFDEVQRIYSANETKFHSFTAVVAMYAGVAAGIAGDLNALEGILKAHGKELAPLGFDALLESYASALRGEPNVSLVAPAASAQLDYALWQWALLQAQADVLNGKTVFRSEFANWGETFPHDRLGWLLLDRYERMQPSPDGPAFYETLDWLHGDDPWVVQTVREARERKVVAVAGDAEKVAVELKGLPATRWPDRGPLPRNPGSFPSCWRVAAAVHQLMLKDPAKARAIACQNYAIVVNLNTPGPRFFANHLIHLVEQANH